MSLFGRPGKLGWSRLARRAVAGPVRLTSFTPPKPNQPYFAAALVRPLNRASFTNMTAHDEKRVAAGLKAAIHNPNVSDEARERAQERLDQMGEEDTTTARHHATGTLDAQGHETNRVLGGYKATLHNPRTSEEAKRHAREILEADGYTVEAGEGVSEDQHQIRVLAGYKAALHNPRVSKEAKEHAKEYLAEHNAL